MKTLAVLAAAAILLAAGSAALAGGLFGPPEPEARRDQVSVGGGYESAATSWKAGGGGFGDVSVSRTQAYVQLTDALLGLSERGAGLLRLGAADFDDGEAFQSGYKPFGAVGLKDVWYGEKRKRYQIGTIFLASYYTGYEAEKRLPSGSIVKARIKYEWDIGLGVAVQVPLGTRFSVYGGPMFVYGNAKVTRSGAGFDGEASYREKNPAGLFGGATLSLSRKLVAVVEAQARSDVSFGAAVAWSLD